MYILSPYKHVHYTSMRHEMRVDNNCYRRALSSRLRILPEADLGMASTN